jgi:hypothetical protein
LDGADLWWLTQQGIGFVVPAKANMTVTADAQALAAAGAGVVARRVHTMAHGQGKHCWTERLETAVVGIAAFTTYDQYGPAEPARQRYRKDFAEHPLHAVVVRKWHNRDYGPGGKVVLLTNETVDKPLTAFDAYDDRRLIEHCCIKESKQAWNLKHPPRRQHAPSRCTCSSPWRCLHWPRRTAWRQSRRRSGTSLWAGSAGGGNASSRTAIQ